MASSHSTDGREYAKLSEVREGDVLECDDGFTCMKPAKRIVNKREDGTLWVPCREGEHDLDGQCDDGEHIIGMFKVEM